MKEMLPGRDLNGIAQTYLSSLLLPQVPIFHKEGRSHPNELDWEVEDEKGK